MKTIMTNSYPIYESDDGFTIGILDSNGDPVLTLNNKLVVHDGKCERYFETITAAAQYYKTHFNVIKGLINGANSSSLKGYKAWWNNE